MPTRRDFVRSAAAAASLPALAGMTSQEELWRAPVLSTGERIARVGLGTWQTFDVGDDRTRRLPLAETLRVFAAAGASLVDTSPMYGSSETVLGDLLAQEGLHDRLMLATKVWTTGADAGAAQMNDSARKLRTARLDLIQIHNLVDWRAHLRTLRAWKEQGRIRYLGITHYQGAAIDQVAAILRDEPVDFVQLNLSLDEPDAAARILPLCARRGVAFIANRPFGGGASFRRVRERALPPWAADAHIASWAQLMLKWILAHEEVTCAIPGTGNPRHLADNLGAARGPRPDPGLRDRIARAWRAA